MFSRTALRRCMGCLICLLLLTTTGCDLTDRPPANSGSDTPVSTKQPESTAGNTTGSSVSKTTVKQPDKTTDNKVTASKATSTKATTARTTTATTKSPVPDADLYFPVAANGQVGNQPDSQLTVFTVRFEQAERMVRLELPHDITVKMAGNGIYAYAELYRKDERIGRLVPNYFLDDFIGSEIVEETTYSIQNIQTRRYVSGQYAAITYSAFIYVEDNFFYLLEMDANSIRQTDFAACANALCPTTLLVRDNRLYLKDKSYLRIAIAGNSFVASSQIAYQLQDILNANGKNATVSGYSYGYYQISSYLKNTDFMNQVYAGEFDVLFLCGAYGAGDITALAAIKQACERSDTQLVLFPAHNESADHMKTAYLNTEVKLGNWREAINNLIRHGIPESDLVIYDSARHSKELAGYAGAVMIYGMLYETAPHATQVAVNYCGVTLDTAQKVELLVMDYMQSYFE